MVIVHGISAYIHSLLHQTLSAEMMNITGKTALKSVVFTLQLTVITRVFILTFHNFYQHHAKKRLHTCNLQKLMTIPLTILDF